jgi:hypothetical protein
VHCVSEFRLRFVSIPQANSLYLYSRNLSLDSRGMLHYPTLALLKS